MKTFPIICHQGRWYELYRDKPTNQGFLGPFCSEVHATDVDVTPREEPVDKPEPDDSDEEDELESALRHTLVTIDPMSPGSPHREGQEPWAPLVTPTRQYSTPTSAFTQQ